MATPTPNHAPIASSRVGDWLDRLAAPVPDPGGGAASGLVIAAGASLVAMASGYAAESAERAHVHDAAVAAVTAALAAADQDAAQSGALVAAFRLPETDPERRARILAASSEAAESSQAMVEIAATLLLPLRWLQREGASRLAPDVAVAARLLAAGIRAAAVNVACDATSAAAFGAPGSEIASLRARQRRAEDIADELDALAGDVTRSL